MTDMLSSRSAVADGVCRILQLLHSQGILIMDEVDVILNPLRSELNFPIGNAVSMPGFRWDLPIYLIDIIFFPVRQHLCEPTFESPADEVYSPTEVESMEEYERGRGREGGGLLHWLDLIGSRPGRCDRIDFAHTVFGWCK